MRVWRPKELCTEAGALKNVAMIHQYWWALGHTKVEAWPVRIGDDASKAPVWGVQSNLIGGLPA